MWHDLRRADQFIVCAAFGRPREEGGQHHLAWVTGPLPPTAFIIVYFSFALVRRADSSCPPKERRRNAGDKFVRRSRARC